MPRRKGFTLVEMLVVIGIILVLLGLVSPMVMRSWRAGDRARTTADLQAIAAALEAYRTDHGDYPRVDALPYPGATDNKYNGARVLCRALIGPGPGVGPAASGADGAGATKNGAPASALNPETEPAPGFRLRGTQGRVYGPYLKVDTFKLGNPALTANQMTPPIGLWALLDRYGKPILYYPATGKGKSSVGNFIRDYDPAQPLPAAGWPFYNAHDNIGAMQLQMFSVMMGDTNPDGKIDASASPPESPAYDGPFILWSAGPDETFGINGAMPAAAADRIKAVKNSDDITNFRQ